MNMSIPADVNPKKLQPKRVTQSIDASPTLSIIANPNFPKDNIKTRKIAFLVADGFDHRAVSEMKKALLTEGAAAITVAPHLGVLTGAGGEEIKADQSFLTTSSVLFDAVYVPGGDESVAALTNVPESVHFLKEAYKHCKTIAASGAGIDLLESAGVVTTDLSAPTAGIVIGPDQEIAGLGAQFINAIAQHRHWDREPAV
jgi:catalase